jgi:hypothetical protein
VNDARLDFLLDRYFDEALSEEECAELDQRIRACPSTRKIFWERQRLHSQLRQLGQQSWGPGRAAGVSPSERPASFFSGPNTRKWGRWAALLVGAALIAKLIAFFAPRESPQSLSLLSFSEKTSRAVAVLAQSVDAVWEAPESAKAEGTLFPPGKLHLRSGLAAIDFFCGARVFLQGPVQFEIRSTKEGFCFSGKLSSVVPPSAVGFRIGTPKMTLVDKGTEFGLDVQNDGSSVVRVIKGEVELHQGGTPVSLPEGQGAAVDTRGILTQTEAGSEEFPDARLLRVQAADAQRRQREEWKRRRDRLRAAPGLLAYFPFESRSDESGSWERTLLNETPGATLESHGAIVGTRWTEGRWPGKRALDFRSLSDLVRIRIPGEFESLTLATSVRIDALANPLNALLLTDGFDPGEIHWQITLSGELRLGICGPDRKTNPKSCKDYDSPPVLPVERLGQWIQLAVVIDQTKGQVSHFLNGQRVSVEPLAFRHTLRIGAAELGNWNMADYLDLKPIRNMNGRMEELLIFSRALGDEEVAALAQ